MKKLISNCSECGVSVYKVEGAMSDSYCFTGEVPVKCKACGIHIRRVSNDPVDGPKYVIRFKPDDVDEHPITECKAEAPAPAPDKGTTEKKRELIMVGIAVAVVLLIIALV